MRGKISDQDLTDYAMNELEPHDRLYVESMLAVSEECRADVYDLIEIGQMIDEGFEREEVKTEDLSLTAAQRSKLLVIRRHPLAMVRNAAAVFAAAACVAFALTHPALWPDRGTAVKVAQVSKDVAKVMSHGISPAQSAGMSASFDSLRALVQEPAKWIPEAASAVCTPPQWLDVDADPMGGMGLPDLGGAVY